MINEDFCSYEVAKLLKEKGFNEPCIATYNSTTKNFQVEEIYEDWTIHWKGYISAPTHQMAMKWLREMHEIQCVIMYRESGYYEPQIFCLGEWINEKELDGCFSYEQAVEAALKYCLENLI